MSGIEIAGQSGYLDSNDTMPTHTTRHGQRQHEQMDAKSSLPKAELVHHNRSDSQSASCRSDFPMLSKSAASLSEQAPSVKASMGGKSIVVIGVSSQITRALLPALSAQGHSVRGVSRHTQSISSVPVHVLDTANLRCTPALDHADAIISLAPLPSINLALDLCQKLNCNRLIAFGTTGVFTKANSPSPEERVLVEQQLGGEKRLSDAGDLLGINWTLFRPTMIYGASADHNVAFIRSMIRRFHCFPMPIGARGARQPVHLADLASACTAALYNTMTFNRAYNLGGGEVLLYEDMVRRIRDADGHDAPILPIPLFVYHALVRLARRMPAFNYLREEMVDRMYADLVTDNTEASRDFGYSPRHFEPPGLIASSE